MAQNLPDHIVPINSETHLNKKLKPVTDFSFVANQHAVPGAQPPARDR